MNRTRSGNPKASLGFVGVLGLAMMGGVFIRQSQTMAHSNGHESRTPAQCERLPGTEREGERAQCLRCVSRPRPHHYHPDYPAGQRCRPDDGRP